MAVNVAKECLLAAAKADPRAAHVWVNLANAYYLVGDHRTSGKCLEKVLLVLAQNLFCTIFFRFLLVLSQGKKYYCSVLMTYESNDIPFSSEALFGAS